jgi:luciferase family oxidoreductase group 1
MIPLSVLDLVTVREGGTVAQALEITIETARVAERAGYKRYWVAEHHGMEGIAGGATSVVLAALGNATSTIRIGAGGIMLPNHTPYVIAEQFGTLAALFPGRVDLGLGRAAGADGRLAHALRKDIVGAADRFPQDVVELRARFAGQAVGGVASPQASGADVEMWILGSSLFGCPMPSPRTSHRPCSTRPRASIASVSNLRRCSTSRTSWPRSTCWRQRPTRRRCTWPPPPTRASSPCARASPVS